MFKNNICNANITGWDCALNSAEEIFRDLRCTEKKGEEEEEDREGAKGGRAKEKGEKKNKRREPQERIKLSKIFSKFDKKYNLTDSRNSVSPQYKYKEKYRAQLSNF